MVPDKPDCDWNEGQWELHEDYDSERLHEILSEIIWDNWPELKPISVVVEE